MNGGRQIFVDAFIRQNAFLNQQHWRQVGQALAKWRKLTPSSRGGFVAEYQRLKKMGRPVRSSIQGR